MIDTSGLPFAKPSKKKTCLDMRELPLGKTNRKQRIDLKPRKNRTRSRCIIPGCRNPVGKGRHHIIQKAMIVLDHEFNLLDVCDFCHPKCDEGEISQVDQFELKAHGLGITVEELLKTLENFAGVKLFVDGPFVRVEKPVFQRRR
jgi:hypothetical protein